MAAHLSDLKAARECGYQTIYVEREDEEDWAVEEVMAARREGWIDMWISLDEPRMSKWGGLGEVRARFAVGDGGRR